MSTEVEGKSVDARAIEGEIAAVARNLVESVRGVIGSLGLAGSGPVAVGAKLRVDKVLASRVLKALRARDPLSAVHAMPGPEPMRRLVRAAARQGATADRVRAAEAAVDAYERLIRVEVGDRGLLDAVVSASLPEARREFELRRKQSAFRAMSQLKGLQASVVMGSVFVAPSADPTRNDIVWVTGVIGVHRLRPGAVVKLTTRRMSASEAARRPTTLDGHEITSPDHLTLREFCSDPMPKVDAHRMGEVVWYTLGDRGIGARSGADVIFAEVNRAELPRRCARGSNRYSYYFVEATPPSEVMQFDLFVHRDLYAGQEPALQLYDTSFEGVANVNDPARQVDRMDLKETIESLGIGSRARSADVARYSELVDRVYERLGWKAEHFRVYRCRIAYPVYGTQATMVFRAEEE